MYYIYKNLIGLKAKQNHKVKLKILIFVNFLTLLNFFITPLSYKPIPNKNILG